MRLRGIHASMLVFALAVACSGEAAPEGSSVEAETTVDTATATTAPVSAPEPDPGDPVVETMSASRRSTALGDLPPEPTVRSLRAAGHGVGSSAQASPASRPLWLGTRPLELRDDGFGVVLPTPGELIGRALPPSTRLGPGSERFEATVEPVPEDVLDRSTWHEGCPVAPTELAYLTLTYRGFDGASHVGEMVVHGSVADDVVEVFRSIFDAGFPIEEMRVIAPSELAAHPTGDGNVTTGFVCRSAVGSGSWSQHARGLAIDVNPFQNPYRKGDLVLPELASHYLDRTLDLSGMIVEGGPVVTAFDAIGWGWGGRWRTLDDYHHFSSNGR